MAARRATEFSEKEFYLDEFRGRTVLFAVHHEGPPEALRDLGTVARDLLLNDTRVLILLGGSRLPGRGALRALERPLAALPAAGQASLPFPALPLASADGSGPVVTLPAEEVARADLSLGRLVQLWAVLRTTPFFLGLCVSDADALAHFAQGLGARLRVHKLVIAHAAGGLQSAGAARPLSFMDEAMTEQLLHAGEAEASVHGVRRPTLEAIRAGLLGGISSINLCPLAGVARELFTYEGSGTLFTREDYCRVERLGVDDFHEVERLLERGRREGYLKVRSAAEVARILLSGYGATIGQHHLAGVCALETDEYERARAGEIVGLYTITRFKGEGVGVKLVERVAADARALGLAYLFAVTTQEHAAQFFERQGFRRVPQDGVPPAKWRGYERGRRAAAITLRRDLAAGAAG